ncbi:MAG: pyridoxamine 5'-phosphate oxidase family protein [Acidobacteriota bacterium]|nr:pyridoxamine 5'-phosphate oxidase family protein [Acidobacteriota bacterium]
MLSRAESLRLLAAAAGGGAVGRLAVSSDGAPLLQPFNFAYVAGQVVVRVGDGLMWRRAAGRLVAFEVEGTDAGAFGPLAWSVVVRGLASPVPDDTLAAGSGAPAPLVPSPGDRLLAVRADAVTGRRFAPRTSGVGAGTAPTPAPAGRPR